MVHLTYLHCLQYSFFAHLFNLYCNGNLTLGIEHFEFWLLLDINEKHIKLMKDTFIVTKSKCYQID